MRFGVAEMFEQGVRPPEVARRLRVSRKSGYAWHVAWREGGRSALASKGLVAFRVSSAMTGPSAISGPYR